ncbi:gliding motility-associated ABC transporter substrate-binding protein GldG [Frigoriflavimonas asaccharolytica]|uniref:Gliding-associated putative ABC transporter substrate-binding component GldG n=1 Tax=Frigoriflavimonas asaccharolytica TaxID=2735899 RepID=A0A8J8K7V6_9FLAO|nr:gliding motility-associated ABC transporter substrate-binding protein GldG [Frigoriflavimonas asaccharolytica]NRS91906.1 gliding-associated putative ABC transporter substrate-binding component GldG [Frigoriflavimonas asaccharolytica]
MKNKSIFIYSIIGLFFIMGAVGVFSTRVDLTQDQRYTLTNSTKEVLKSVQKPLMVEVYLDGDFPANFKQLQSETKFMLEEFKKINPKVDFKFIDPIKSKVSKDSLAAMGLEASMLASRTDGKVSQIELYPYAVLKYQDLGVSIPLIVQQNGLDQDQQLYKSVEGLEYNLISNIKDITVNSRKNVGILINQDELRPEEFRSFTKYLLATYKTEPIIPVENDELSLKDFPKLKQMDALLIAKPRKAFTDKEKVILDQYIMNGGKTLWMIDAVNAEMDSLYQAKKIMAFPYETNLNDFFFNYGIRINTGLVKDMQKSALLRIVSGEVAGNPQYSSFLWPYFPLGISDKNNPITKNINPVKFEFPTSIDILKRPGIKPTVLFESSQNTLINSVPNYIQLSEIVKEDSISPFEQKTKQQNLAVLLEGTFQSAYANRSEKNDFPNFKSENNNGKMIVIADGDIGRNQILKGQALPLGVDLLTQEQYGNGEFLQNALSYLLDDTNIMELKNREIAVRLLDRQTIEENKSYWQWFNMLLPLFIIGIFAGLFYFIRKRKFE